jgi:tetratricopeptide (TPR) repeat protein
VGQIKLPNSVEALRFDIVQGNAARALPQVEERLAKVESWWRQHCAGQRVPEAPDPVFLARGIISLLDIAVQAYFALQKWESALYRIDEIVEVQRALEQPAEEIAPAQMNRAIALGKLGRFGEAQAELESCLQVFQHDPANSAKVISSLASLFKEQGDVAQAITQQRRSLALFEQLPYPRDRATSHDNLANYLELSGEPPALAESPRHQLAALIYRLVVKLGQDLQQLSRVNYVIRFRRALAAGTSLVVLRVADLLADAAFRSLDDWLRRKQVDVDKLQADVDQFIETARQEALKLPTEPSP